MHVVTTMNEINQILYSACIQLEAVQSAEHYIESNLAKPVNIQIPTLLRRIKLFYIPSKFALCAKYSHIVDFLGSSRMATAPTSIEVLLRPTLRQPDEPSDLRGSLSPTTRHRCTHVLVYTAPRSPRWSPIQLWTGPGVA